MDEYVFEPGTHVYTSGCVKVVIHAGNGVTKKQMEPAVKLFAHYRDENAKKKTAAATAVI